MRAATHARAAAGLALPHVPLLESADLPGDDWSLPAAFQVDEGFGDDDRFATLKLECAFDD